MKIAVTGATGCLGMNLCPALIEQGHQVIAIARNTTLGKILTAKGAIFKVCDISKTTELNAILAGCEVVIHAAALSSHWGRYQDFYQANVLGTLNVLKTLPVNSRFIHISTPSLYFDFKHRFSIDEKTKIDNKWFPNHYIKTKYKAEQLVTKAIMQDSINAIILRPRGIFGPFDRALLGQLIHAKSGIPLIGNGKNIVDITYVGNVVHAIELLLSGNEHCLGKTYNITNDEPLAYRQLATLLLSQLQRDVAFKKLSYRKAYVLGWLMEKIYTLPIIKQAPILTRYVAGVLHFSQTLSLDAAKKDFEYHPIFSIDQGMAKYVDWLQTDIGRQHG